MLTTGSILWDHGPLASSIDIIVVVVCSLEKQ